VPGAPHGFLGDSLGIRKILFFADARAEGDQVSPHLLMLAALIALDEGWHAISSAAI
jgi:hypothetical protein